MSKNEWIEWQESVGRAANVAQLLSFLGIGELISNQNLMEELENQNQTYLAKILTKLESIERRLDDAHL